MTKNLLLLLLICFAFTSVNAQNIISTDDSCVTNGTSDTYEFEPQVTLVNGKYDYVRIAAATPLGDLYGAGGGNGTVGIQFDGSQWVFYYNSNPANIVFAAPDNGALYPPATGWVSDGAPCSNPSAALELNGNVLAQEHIATTTALSCAGEGVLEFVSVTSYNGSDTYRALSSIGNFDQNSTWGLGQGATLTPNFILLYYSTGNSRWEISEGLSTVLFIQTTAGPGKAPADGWVGSGSPCLVGDEASFVSENSGVLPAERVEFSTIKIYPNPSTRFINISNLKEKSRVVISNITGQVVKDVVVGVNDNRIDIQDLSQGFYFVELEGKKTIKLLKR